MPPPPSGGPPMLAPPPPMMAPPPMMMAPPPHGHHQHMGHHQQMGQQMGHHHPGHLGSNASMPPIWMAPDPLLPPKLPPQPGQEEFYRREDDWPPRHYHKTLGEAIYVAQETPGNIRHDITIEKRCIGRLLGKGGRHLEAMQENSGCCIFIIDKDVPPGEGEEHRLLILCGCYEAVKIAKEETDKVLERAKKELPPLPPPKSSGWRPSPFVGNVDDH